MIYKIVKEKDAPKFASSTICKKKICFNMFFFLKMNGPNAPNNRYLSAFTIGNNLFTNYLAHHVREKNYS